MLKRLWLAAADPRSSCGTYWPDREKVKLPFLGQIEDSKGQETAEGRYDVRSIISDSPR